MSYLVIARKWRPQSFEEIVGQEHISQTLQNAIRSNRVAHAFLFTGVRGVGKTTAARILAKALNCEQGPTPTPCNQCGNCQEITAGNAVDVLEIDGASNTGVDDVREIIENVRYQPARSRFKIYIIDEVHMLSTSAFNALLKTLEEPPPHVKFIFATTDPHKVPHTIHSRCQRYDFKRIAFRSIAERLAQIAASEGIEVSEQALFAIAREGEGSMRDAQSLFDQVIAFAGKTVEDGDIGKALGLADRRLISAIGAAIVGKNPTEALAALHEVHQHGYDLRRFTRDLLEHFRNLAVARLVDDGQLLGDLPDEERAEVKTQAQRMGSEDLDRAFRLLIETENEVARVPYPRLVLEMAVIKLATLAPVAPIDALLERLDDFDRRVVAGTPAGTGGASPPAREKSSPAPTARVAPSSTVRSTPAAIPPPEVIPKARIIPPASPTENPRSTRDATWADFLAFVGKEKVLFLPYLQTSQAPDLSEDEAVLRVPPGHFYDYLAEPSHTQVVKELLARFFGRSIEVAVQPVEPTAVAPSAAVESKAEIHKKALDHPAVQAAVQILGGEVQEVRPRPTRRGRETE